MFTPEERAQMDADDKKYGVDRNGNPLVDDPKVITLGKLNEQLKIEQERLLNINLADKEAIRLQREKVKAIEEQIKSYKVLTDEELLRKLKQLNKELTKAEPDWFGKVKEFAAGTRDVYARIIESTNKGVTGAGMARGGGTLAGGPKELKGQVEDLTNALYYQAEAVNILSNGFSQLFSSTGNGFQGMIDTIIEGIKRMVAELLAKAAILTLIRVLLPGPGPAVNATTGLMNMFGSGLFSGGGSAGNVGGIVSQGVNVNVQGVIKGKDIALSLMRNQ
jgi:hypothetical protein